MATSDILSVWVNRPPKVSITSPNDESEVTVGSAFKLDALGTVDPDGDELTLSWNLDGSEEPVAIGPTGNLALEVGTYTLTLVAIDPDDLRTERSIQVHVLPIERSTSEIATAWLTMVIILVILTAALTIAILVRRRGLSGPEPPI